MRRFLAAATALALTALLLAPAALAFDGGQGTYGEADDKVVTNTGFILIIAFPVIITVLSIAQWRLDKRKKERLAAQKARARSAEWRGGW
jgi:uncharacterized membrane protein YidH (DUF202 family)